MASMDRIPAPEQSSEMGIEAIKQRFLELRGQLSTMGYDRNTDQMQGREYQQEAAFQELAREYEEAVYAGLVGGYIFSDPEAHSQFVTREEIDERLQKLSMAEAERLKGRIDRRGAKR